MGTRRAARSIRVGDGNPPEQQRESARSVGSHARGDARRVRRRAPLSRRVRRPPVPPAANRYPAASEGATRAAIARSHGIPEDSVLLGCGSGEILRMAVFACVAPDRPLVAGAPTFEDPGHYARLLKSDPIDVPVDGALRL